MPFIAFLLIIGVGVGFAMQHQSQAKQELKKEESENTALGLPADYPRKLVPVYPGLTIKETERGTAKATDGVDLLKWVVNGETADGKEKVFEYYNDLLIEQGMRQTMYISIPSGVAVHYGDEENIAEFEIERLPDSPVTTLKMTLYVTAQ